MSKAQRGKEEIEIVDVPESTDSTVGDVSESPIEVVEVQERQSKPSIRRITSDRPLPDQILDFLQQRDSTKPILINDFLKSTVPLHVGIGTPEYMKQGFSKAVKNALSKLIEEKKIRVQSDVHVRLGKAFYDGDNPVTQYYSIVSVPIYVELI